MKEKNVSLYFNSLLKRNCIFLFAFLIAITQTLISKNANAQAADFTLQASLFEDSVVHIIWHNNSSILVDEYILQKNVENTGWQSIDSTQNDSLTDITTLSENTPLNVYGDILYSTETGIGGFIKNEIITDVSKILFTKYRIKAKLNNETYSFTDPVNVLGTSISNETSQSQFGPIVECSIDNLNGFIKVLPESLKTISDPCCVKYQKLYYRNEVIGYTPGCTLKTSQNDCNTSIGGSDCTHLNSYDPCCGHIGACYARCNCGTTIFGASAWTTCNAVLGPKYYWKTVSLGVGSLNATFSIPSGCITTGQLINLCASQAPAFNITYSWNITSANVTSATTQCVNNVYWSNPGTYTITLNVSDGNCTVSSSIDIIISTPQTCCESNTNFSYTVFNAPAITAIYQYGTNGFGNATTPVYIKDQMLIPSGADITIRNMVLRFGVKGRITIMPGAKLTLEGSTLSGNDNCQLMWQGVEVIGTGQFSTAITQANQGQFFMNPNSSGTSSKIEYALTGVCNREYGSSTFLTSGGHYECSKGIFENCNISIGQYGHIDSYTGNPSLIQNCTFRKAGTGLWYPMANSNPDRFVDITNSRGAIDILFVSNSSLQNTFDGGGSGIYMADVNNIDVNSATFSNSVFGVYSIRSSSATPTQHDLTNLSFISCSNGIRLLNTSNDNISNCNFNQSYGVQSVNFYGVYLDGTYDFKVYDNIFNHLKYAVWCNNSGTIGGRITSGSSGTGNTFNECYRGVNFTGDNQNVQVRCNTFNNVTQGASDFSVGWYSEDLPNQGTGGINPIPAGNEFYRSGTRKDINVTPGVTSCASGGSNYNFCYYRHSSPAPVIPTVATALTVSVQFTSLAKVPTYCQTQGLQEKSGNSEATAILTIENEQDPVQQQLWINELIGWYLATSREADAINYLKDKESQASYRMLFGLYLANHDFEKAEQALNQICLSEETNDRNFCILNTTVLNWSKENIRPSDMSTEEREMITTFAGGNSEVSGQAQSILEIAFSEIVEGEVSSDTGSTRIKDRNSYLANQLLCFPNPVISEIMVKDKLATEDVIDDYTFTILDGSGRLVQEINLKGSLLQGIVLKTTNRIENGMYILKVVSKDKEPLRCNIFIQKN